MAAFEFGNYPKRGDETLPQSAQAAQDDPGAIVQAGGKVISEPMLALKIYDSCRYKNCLQPSDLGPALDMDGVPIAAPIEAQSVGIDNLHVSNIIILSKEANSFRNGFWDVELQYVMRYDLRFTGQGGVPISIEKAQSNFTQRASLFGSVGAEVTITTDLLAGGQGIMRGEPFVIAEARAIGLAAEIKRRHCSKDTESPMVFPTIGLFSIIKLFRLVSLLVESRGFVMPPTCGNILPPNPCDFFEELDFPMDTFSPPQRAEFFGKAGGGPCSSATADAPEEAVAEAAKEVE